VYPNPVAHNPIMGVLTEQAAPLIGRLNSS
jgi:hypothetical protein